jgi:hypothetical protein
MKKQFFLLISGICALLIIAACSKDDNDTPAKTKTEMIATGSWSFDKALSGSTDISGFVNACYKDNIVTFTSSGTGTVQNTIVCTPMDNTPSTFTWSWQTNETILSLNAALFPGGTGTFNLVSLSETSLVVSQVVDFGSGPTNVTFYYKH